MPHNVSLPRHRYVGVVPEFVLRAESLASLIPAVWVGVSVTPGRALGCHVLLENGALVVDVPLHALRARPGTAWTPVDLREAVAWDCFGWDAECWEPAYVSGLDAALLSPEHELTTQRGTLWFAVDHLTDGFALEPAQHKHLWVVHRHQDDALLLLPQDRLLIEERSFTDLSTVPPIRRQTTVWSAE